MALRDLYGAGEAAASMGSGLFASVPAGLYGLLSLELGPEEAERRMKMIQDYWTYQPRTPEGEAALRAAGDAGKLLDAPFKLMGDKTMELTGSPAAAAAAYSVPQVATGLFAGSRLAKGLDMGDVSRVQPQFKRQKGVIAARAPNTTPSLPSPTVARAVDPVTSQQLMSSPSGVVPGITVQASHFSTDPNLEAIRAGNYGSNWAGGEAPRLTGPIGSEIRPRVFAYENVPGMKPEAGVGPNRYDFEVAGIYDLSADPEGLVAAARQIAKEKAGNRRVNPQASQNEVANLYEQFIRDAGYRGVVDRKAKQGSSLVLFEDVDLTGKLDTAREAHGLLASRLGGNVPPETAGLMGQAAGVGTSLNVDVPRVGKLYRGSPNVRSPQKLTAEQRRLSGMAIEGIDAADWYVRDAMNNARMTSGQYEPMRQIGAGLAITSPQMKVAGNAVEGARAYYQNLVGDAIQAGRFPADMAVSMRKILDDEAADIGRKRGSFLNNEMQYFPELTQGTTIDMQMKRAGGYRQASDALTDNQYEYMERVTKKIADKLNEEKAGGRYWKPDDVQAAIWTAQKMRDEGTTSSVAGGNFVDAYQNMTASMPWETRPGVPNTTGGFPTQSMNTGFTDPQQLMYQDLTRGLIDEWGNAVVPREMGLLQMPSHRGMGVWEAERNPNVVSNIVTPMASGRVAGQAKVDAGLGNWERTVDPNTGKYVEQYKSAGTGRESKLLELLYDTDMDPSVAKATDAAAAVQGLALDQAGAAYTRPIMGKGPGYAQNFADIKMKNFDKQSLAGFEGTLSKIYKSPEFIKKHPAAKDMEIIVTPGKDGVQAFRPYTEARTTEGAAESLKKNAAAKAAINAAIKKYGETASDFEGYGAPDVSWGVAPSRYLGYDDYLSAIKQSGMTDQALAAYSKVRPFIEKHQEWYAKQYPEQVQRQINASRPAALRQGGLFQ